MQTVVISLLLILDINLTNCQEYWSYAKHISYTMYNKLFFLSSFKSQNVKYHSRAIHPLIQHGNMAIS